MRKIDGQGKRIVELYIWVIIAFIVRLPQIYTIATTRLYIDQIIAQFYDKLLISVIIAIFPIVFNLIFDHYPLEYLRFIKRSKSFSTSEEEVVRPETQNAVIELSKTQIDNKTKRCGDVFLSYVIESCEISRKIYNRSGAYLLFGCFIALGGVLLFYSQSTTNSFNQNFVTLELVIVSYLPRLGALIFIEYIAFFFLKQYRIMMEEYRYYERVKRRRQDNYYVIKMIAEDISDHKEIEFMLSQMKFDDGQTILSEKETTEILESHKLSNEEFKVIENITELIKALRVNKK